MPEPQTANGVPDGWQVVTPPPPRTAPPADESTLGRMGAAVGPAIRGAGDITGANWFLEKTLPGLVPQGRLTGDEATPRDAATRHATAVGGVAMGAVQGIEAIASAGVTRGLTAAGRAVAAARAAGQMITPTLKYEIYKRTLEAVGVPAPIAWGVANMIAGGSEKRATAKTAPAPHVPTAEGYVGNVTPPREPVAAPAPAAPYETAIAEAKSAVAASPSAAPIETPGAGGTPPAPGSPPPAPIAESPTSPRSPAGPSPAQVANQVALQARRQAVTLSAKEDAVAQAMVREHGVLPKDAVATVAANRGIVSKLNLSPEEATQFQLLSQAGKSETQALSAIEKMRKLAKGLPSTAQVETAVADRNATGKWTTD
jgi:hypothetical protein